VGGALSIKRIVASLIHPAHIFHSFADCAQV
jgi:hypothetical protein